MEHIMHTTGALLRVYVGFATWSLEMAYNSNCAQFPDGFGYLRTSPRFHIERALLTAEMDV